MKHMVEGGTDRQRSVEGPTQVDLEGLRRRTLILLAIATVVGGTGLGAGGAAGALLGEELSGSESAAGLPLGLLVAGSAGAGLLISRWAASIGRGPSLALGYALGVLGAVIVIIAAVASSFLVLLAGSVVLGAGYTAMSLTRYAAAAISDEATRGRAIGAIFFTTTLGAVISPSLLGPSGEMAGALGLPELTGLYLVSMLAFTAAALILAAASSRAVPFVGRGAALLGSASRTVVARREIVAGLSNPPARAALIVLAAANLIMVGIMAMMPLHLSGHGHDLDLIGIVVGIHVAGMFAPSPVSGWLADRFGPVLVATIGISLLVATGVAGASVDQSSALAMTLILATLGIGWNFGVVGGSALLAASVPETLRPNIEGLGEVAMGLAAAAGTPIAGVIVAFGGFTSLSLVAATVAVLALAFGLRVQWTGDRL